MQEVRRSAPTAATAVSAVYVVVQVGCVVITPAVARVWLLASVTSGETVGTASP